MTYTQFVLSCLGYRAAHSNNTNGRFLVSNEANSRRFKVRMHEVFLVCHASCLGAGALSAR